LPAQPSELVEGSQALREVGQDELSDYPPAQRKGQAWNRGHQGSTILGQRRIGFAM
jgi:hypothetical protein